MTTDDESDLVRRGCNALSYRYRRDDAAEGRYAPWILSVFLAPSWTIERRGKRLCAVPARQTHTLPRSRQDLWHWQEGPVGTVAAALAALASPQSSSGDAGQ